jgi:hypothetical protein
MLLLEVNLQSYLEVLQWLLTLIIILPGLFCLAAGYFLGKRAEKRDIIKKLRLSGKVDPATIALLEG